MRSIAAGHVESVYYNHPSWGYAVVVENVGFPDSGISFAVYMHMQSNLITDPDYLRPRAMVLRGTPLGYVGNTGSSTAPHLHFQVDKPNPNNAHPYWPQGNVNDPYDEQVPNNTFNPMPFIYAHGVHTLFGPIGNPVPAAGHYVYLDSNNPNAGPQWVVDALYQGYMGYRPDAEIDFEWGYGAPWPGGASDFFGAFWEGQICGIDDGNPHLFMLTTDDGVRVWLYGNLLFDTPNPQPPTTYGAVVDWIPPGVGCVTLWMRWYDHGGHAVSQLSWG